MHQPEPTAKCDRMQRLEAIARLKDEKTTLSVMVRDYCRRRHGTQDALCPECAEFLAYALKRLACCPYGEKKPVCAKCRIHCYKPEYRATARMIMREAGPRLMLTHPILAAKHLWQSVTVKAPEKPRNRRVS
ncbi:MAG: nitrous oxide-stimulated promoter family protein [Duodenibacillus sp.]